MTRPVSVSTAAYDGYPMEVAVAGIAGLGAALVEPAFIAGYVDFTEDDFSAGSAARLRGVMAAEGVSALSVSAHIDLGADGAPARLARRIGFAAGLGAEILVTNFTTRDREAAGLRTVGGALPALEEAGLVLALENPGHGEGAALAGAADFARVLGRIDAPVVRGNYDLGNVFTYSRGAVMPADDVAGAVPMLAGLHAKDVAAAGGDWRFVAIGDGDLGYRDLRRRLDVLAPGLPLTLELPLRLLRKGRGDPVRAADPVPLAAIEAAVRRSLAWAL